MGKGDQLYKVFDGENDITIAQKMFEKKFDIGKLSHEKEIKLQFKRLPKVNAAAMFEASKKKKVDDKKETETDTTKAEEESKLDADEDKPAEEAGEAGEEA